MIPGVGTIIIKGLPERTQRGNVFRARHCKEHRGRQGRLPSLFKKRSKSTSMQSGKGRNNPGTRMVPVITTAIPSTARKRFYPMTVRQMGQIP